MALAQQEDIQKYAQELEPWEGLLRIINTPVYLKFLNRPEKTIALFTGNQWGKNANIVKHYITRWKGIHPVESKNLRPQDKIRTYRFCSETLPMDPKAAEDRNTIYPVLKSMIPKFMIRQDITQRNPVMTLIDIFQGGPDFYVEFVSFEQDIQKSAGKQRKSIYIDENCSRSFVEEQIPRLLATDGDMVFGMTPALGQVTWQFEELYENAKVMIRTPLVIKRLKERFGEDHQEIEITGNDTDICVIQAATDDNPFYGQLVKKKNDDEIALIKAGKHHYLKDEKDFKPITKAQYIKDKLGIFDEETEDVRRYGIFRQVSGRIFKDFDTNIHKIDGDKWFPGGIPHLYRHARGIDYHEHVDWHCGMIAISPQDEAFIYDEVVMSPEKFVTAQIARVIAEKGKDFKYALNKIDPLATKTQVNTGLSTVDDLNRIFPELKREGIGTGGYWTSWDTKSTRGREEIRKRLKNARLCGTPFNNKQVVNGRESYLPTLWVLSGCRVAIEHFKNWRLEDWTDRTKLETKEIKETPMQKYSHMNMVWEALFKEEAFKKPPAQDHHIERRHTASQYGRR